MIEPQKKDRIFVLASAAMILPAAFLFYVVSDLPHIFIITLIGFILSLLITPTIKYSDRSIIYSVLIALILAVVFNMIFPMKQERFFSIAKLFMSQVTVPLILYLAAIATFYESTPYTLGFNAAFAIIVIMLAGDFSLGSQINDDSFFGFLIQESNYNNFFLTIAIINSLAMLFAFNLARRSLFHKKGRGNDWQKISISIIAILISSFIAIGLFSLFHIFKGDIRKIENYLSHLRPRHYFQDSKVLFGREVDLNQTINSDLRKNSNQIMIRVTGEQAPGYLRGRGYQYYNNGKWRESQDTPLSMKYKINIEDLAVNAFFYDSDPGRSGKKFEIYPTSNCLAKYLFYPANTQRFEMVADRLNYTQNGNFFPKSWEEDGGYTAYVEKIDLNSSFPGPIDVSMINYLQIPKDLEETLGKAATEIQNNLPRNYEEQTDMKIAEHIMVYFNNKFNYTLDPETDKDIDPIENFMVKTRKGHCELFATSATLLLRHFGIPARYVTGFVCDESHPTQKYFIARLGNAHAWCEAYLRDEKRWILLEPTPPSGINPFGNKWGWFEVWFDQLKQSSQKMFADVRRGYVARAILAFFADIVIFLWGIFWHSIRGTVISVCLLFLFWFIKYYRKQKCRKKLQLDQQIISLQKDFISLTGFIASKAGMHRLPSDTVCDWTNKIKSSSRLTQKHGVLANFAKINADYQRLRFSSSKLAVNDLTQLKKSIIEFKKGF